MSMSEKYSSVKYCHYAKDIPEGDHFAIVVNRSITIPGDERSRTNPGHGYPESTEHFFEYIAYTDRVEWEEEIRKRMTATYGNKDFVALKVEKASIKLQTIVTVK